MLSKILDCVIIWYVTQDTVSNILVMFTAENEVKIRLDLTLFAENTESHQQICRRKWTHFDFHS